MTGFKGGSQANITDPHTMIPGHCGKVQEICAAMKEEGLTVEQLTHLPHDDKRPCYAPLLGDDCG